jgi:hypothetical protein
MRGAGGRGDKETNKILQNNKSTMLDDLGVQK